MNYIQNLNSVYNLEALKTSLHRSKLPSPIVQAHVFIHVSLERLHVCSCLSWHSFCMAHGALLLQRMAVRAWNTLTAAS